MFVPVLLLGAISIGVVAVEHHSIALPVPPIEKKLPPLSVEATESDPIVAFPGAQGYGAQTVGGRGGRVVHVTTLADSGEGSLRWALESLTGPRIVVFDVGGIIRLKDQILVRDGYVTIAGQSAPGEGVTVSGARIRIKASEIIIRGMHFRPGDGPGQEAGDRDGLMIGTTDAVLRNIIVDHNSFAWAVDENLDINGKVTNVTVSNNIIARGLSRSIHPKGEHSKGMLVSNWGGAADDASNITIIRNLFADNMQRNPEVRAGQNIEIVNNLIRNHGLGYAAISVGGGNKGTLATSVAIVGNVIAPGRSTSKITTPISIQQMGGGSHVAIADNLFTAWSGEVAGDRGQAALYRPYKDASLPRMLDSVPRGSGASLLNSNAVAAHVLANAGAVNAAGRDAVDMRILTDAAAGTGAIIDRPDAAGAEAAKAKAISGAVDSDRDGMPDRYERQHGLDPRKANDSADRDGNGYTNIEDYLNGLIAGVAVGSSR